MNIARRDVIKGIVLSGVAGALPGALAALTANAEEHFRLTSQPGLASQPVSIHILVAGSSLDDPFLDGAVSSARQVGTNPLVVRLKSSLVDDLNQAEELLRSRRPSGRFAGSRRRNSARGTGARQRLAPLGRWPAYRRRAGLDAPSSSQHHYAKRETGRVFAGWARKSQLAGAARRLFDANRERKLKSRIDGPAGISLTGRPGHSAARNPYLPFDSGMTAAPPTSD